MIFLVQIVSIYKSKTSMSLRLKQKKEEQDKQSEYIPNVSKVGDLYSEERINNHPILKNMMEKINISLMKTQMKYAQALKDCGVPPQKIQKLMSNRELRKRMTLRMFKNACIVSKIPAERDIKFQKRQIHLRDESQNQIENQDNQDILIGKDYIERSQQILSNCNFYQQPLSSHFQQNKKTYAQILSYCKSNNLYPKQTRPYKSQYFIFMAKSEELFYAIVEHYELLSSRFTDQTQHNNQFNFVIKHLAVIPIKSQFFYNTEQQYKTWKKIDFAIIMEKGTKFGQPTSYMNRTQNQIENLVDKQDPIEYLAQVAEGMFKLLKHKIYHFDLQYRNIIPVQEGNFISYKLIDFEKALYLGENPDLRNNLKKIWSLLRQYYLQKRHEDNFLTDFFRMICPKQLTQLLNISERQLYRQLLDRQDQRQFVEYLQHYSEYYYRDRLMAILDEIKSKLTNFKNYESVKNIIRQRSFNIMGRLLLRFK